MTKKWACFKKNGRIDRVMFVDDLETMKYRRDIYCKLLDMSWSVDPSTGDMMKPFIDVCNAVADNFGLDRRAIFTTQAWDGEERAAEYGVKQWFKDHRVKEYHN